ncbi:polyprenyl synthetase family protein [Streptomyces purpureus]|uniref:Dimethylallyltransferase n=1 Tax=Streptomyces purpureus TaxID=1951 RepID=A0A918HHW7_9ACTN|nr:polyprenyl synthetase family protein [Streptomyces purpureus]GGT64552.1 dimethylallyltransferase [Streptomyces purpureus]
MQAPAGDRAAAVAGVLARCRELVRPAVVEAVGQLHPWTGEMAAYALGWSDTAGTPDPGGSEGKGVRQALAVLGAEAVGADGGAGVAGAVAVELVHTFSLLHDDIMDGDGLRRQRPAVWKAYGTGPAVLAGDALLALAVQRLAEAPGPWSAVAVRHLSGTLSTLVWGQAEDVRFERLPWSGPGAVGPEQYRSMAEGKTGALLGCAIALGAVLGGAQAGTVAVLERAGRHLGVAFQAVDDLLGIWGDPAVTGKPVHGDLRRRKKTYPVLAALAGGGPAARELAVLLESPGPLDGAAAARAAVLVEEAGGRSATRKEARRHLDAARHALREASLTPAAGADLDALFTYLLDRSW